MSVYAEQSRSIEWFFGSSPFGGFDSSTGSPRTDFDRLTTHHERILHYLVQIRIAVHAEQSRSIEQFCKLPLDGFDRLTICGKWIFNGLDFL